MPSMCLALIYTHLILMTAWSQALLLSPFCELGNRSTEKVCNLLKVYNLLTQLANGHINILTHVCLTWEAMFLPPSYIASPETKQTFKRPQSTVYSVDVLRINLKKWVARFEISKIVPSPLPSLAISLPCFTCLHSTYHLLILLSLHFCHCHSQKTVSSLKIGTLAALLYAQPIERCMEHGGCSVHVSRLNPRLRVLLDISDNLSSRLKLDWTDLLRPPVTYMSP